MRPVAWVQSFDSTTIKFRRIQSKYISSATALTSADVGKCVYVTTGASDVAITLPTTGLTTGNTISVQKRDTGAGKVNVNSNTAWLMTKNDIIYCAWNGTVWKIEYYHIAPKFEYFTSSGTWTKPPLAKSIAVLLVGGGGGGGSGRKVAAGTTSGGGAGGGGGAAVFLNYSTNLFGATESVTVGAGGTGGAAVSANTTSGNNGTDGGKTSLGVRAQAKGGPAGVGNTGSAAGAGWANNFAGGGGDGGVSGANGFSISGFTCGGPGGGGVSSGGSAGDGGGGVTRNPSYVLTGAAGSASGDVNGGNGSGAGLIGFNVSGGRPGGGAGSSTGNAGRGGNGGLYGAGGGGGGGALNDTGNSGAGGSGSAGICVIRTMFQ